ncbi:hypothetical protein [Acidovorax sp. SUPP3334]|uniref:hypothetical protein n=1 Tax=Acidovorax sp. SUPP3334 TaxID=2920881 RepID=UPI0023DE2537|nr:hypothetical protein [Acidovorax sp. SUPP3334]GKT23422.1 hypothetical protein AVHM3334_11570 [Acidovorax sp. SUPP3334]
MSVPPFATAGQATPAAAIAPGLVTTVLELLPSLHPIAIATDPYRPSPATLARPDPHALQPVQNRGKPHAPA